MEDNFLIVNSAKESIRPREMGDEINNTDLLMNTIKSNHKNTNQNTPESNQVENQEDAISSITKYIVDNCRIVVVDLLWKIFGLLSFNPCNHINMGFLVFHHIH